MRIIIHQFPSARSGAERGASAGQAPSDGPEIDMTPEGEFVEAPRLGAGTGFGATLGRWILGLLGLLVVLGVVALAFWMAILILPIVLAVGLIAYAAFRWRMGGFRF